MTDNEIKKALECCTDKTCLHCPYDNEVHCLDFMYNNALDLINRLQADKEALINGQETLQKYLAEQKAENERLKELVDDMGDYFPACINCEGKTEFGERTDKCVYLIDNSNYCTKRGITNIIAISNENRKLKAENENLKAEVETELDKLNAEKNDVMYYKAQIKAEAYKECIEKVNERIAVTTFTNKSEEYSNGFYDAIAWVDGEIDNLFDELVGEDNG